MKRPQLSMAGGTWSKSVINTPVANVRLRLVTVFRRRLGERQRLPHFRHRSRRLACQKANAQAGSNRTETFPELRLKDETVKKSHIIDSVVSLFYKFDETLYFCIRIIVAQVLTHALSKVGRDFIEVSTILGFG